MSLFPHLPAPAMSLRPASDSTGHRPHCGRRLGVVLILSIGTALTAPVQADPIDDYNVASQFYKDQQWEHAEEAFRRFVAQYPNHERVAAARLYEGQALVHQRRFAPARDVFRTFVEKHREHPDLYLAVYRIGECSYFLGDHRAARTELDRFVSAFPKHELTEWALQYLAESQLRLGDAKGAVASLKLQLQRFPQGRLADDARFLQGRALILEGDKQGALQVFQQLAASETSPRAADALLEAGMLLYDARQFQPARDAFTAVRTRFPESALLPVADLNAGYAAYHLGDHDAAIASFQQAATALDQANDAQFWTGMSQKSKGDYAAAAETLRQLADAATDNGFALKARFHAADAELRGGDYADAQAQFLVVVDKSPEGPLSADALHLATEAALLNGSLDDAERLHQRFAKTYSESGLWLLQRLLHGRIELTRGDRAFDAQDQDLANKQYEQAAVEFAAVVQESQVPRTSQLARLLWGRSLDRLDHHAEVITALAPVVMQLAQQDGVTEFAEALSLTARAHLRLNQNQQAANAARLLVDRYSLSDQLPDALASLALAEARLEHDQQVDDALTRLWQPEANRALAQRTTYQLADQAYSTKNWKRAAALFQKLIDGGSGDYQTASLSGLGYSLYEAGDYAAAAKAFEKLVSTGIAGRELAADAAHMRALALRQSGDLAAATEAYESALRQFARASDAQNLTPEDEQVVGVAFQCAKGLARVQSEQNHRDAADKAYATALEQLQLLPANQQQELDKLIHEWAILFYNAEDYDRSDAIFQQLVDLRPDSDLADDARLYIGESHFFGGRLKEAGELFARLADDPKADDFVRQRSLVLLMDIAWEAKDWPSVVAAARKLTDRYPQGDQAGFAAYRLGEALVQTGETSEAVHVLNPIHESTDPALRKAEWFPGVRLLLAEAQLQAKNYAEVETIVKQFRQEDPQSPQLYQADEILARRFKNEARWKEAREAARRVVDSPDGRRTETAAKAQLVIADTFLLEMKDSEAVAEYYKVYLNYKFPDYQAPALHQAAKCDTRLKRWESAVKLYETLLEQFPEYTQTAEAEKELEIARKRVSTESLTDEASSPN